MAAFRKFTHEEMIKEEEEMTFLVRIPDNVSSRCFLVLLFLDCSTGICGFM